MQEGLVIITIVIACLYLGKQAYTWFLPKNRKCDGCSFGKASQE